MMVSEIVTEDMIDRAQAVLAAASVACGSRELARDAITAALNPPEDRACLCGCPHERTGNSRYFSDACRTRHWKAETGYVKPTVRNGENGGNGGETSKSQASRPGGAQVAFGPAVAVWTAYLVRATPQNRSQARKTATRVTRRALSDKQRARLDARREA